MSPRKWLRYILEPASAIQWVLRFKSSSHSYQANLKSLSSCLLTCLPASHHQLGWKPKLGRNALELTPWDQLFHGLQWKTPLRKTSQCLGQGLHGRGSPHVSYLKVHKTPQPSTTSLPDPTHGMHVTSCYEWENPGISWNEVEEMKGQTFIF